MYHGSLSVNFYITIFLYVICVSYDSRALGDVNTNEEPCRPWSSTGPACKHLNRLDLRFIVDLAEENYVNDSKTSVVKTAVYGFAPQIDKLQLFSLSDAASLATLQKNTTNGVVKFSFSKDQNKKYLSVYGFGNSNSVANPENGSSDSSLLIVEKNLTQCGGSGSVAVVTTLMLDVGLHKGLFNYEGDAKSILTADLHAQTMGFYNVADTHSSPDNFSFAAVYGNESNLVEESKMSRLGTQKENVVFMAETSSVKRPLKTGFVSTCGNTKNGEECLLDSEQICIGDKGFRNCARCYKDPSEVASSAKVRVVVSYYGTDSKGRTLTSGTSNPLNFRAFGGNHILKDIQKALKA
ncbi:unnamed protein product [Phytomonas sp. EM1]|nr:unnamed protein product [Phytomonas sp. EM1]|eukprot:CCW61707.1 unnamed protein product [Phytomonas sp. isolate EM1]